jgi:hypothetical protein
LLPANSVNQTAPSGPSVTPIGCELALGSWNSKMSPSVVIWPILLPSCSLNQSVFVVASLATQPPKLP